MEYCGSTFLPSAPHASDETGWTAVPGLHPSALRANRARYYVPWNIFNAHVADLCERLKIKPQIQLQIAMLHDKGMLRGQAQPMREHESWPPLRLRYGHQEPQSHIVSHPATPLGNCLKRWVP